MTLLTSNHKPNILNNDKNFSGEIVGRLIVAITILQITICVCVCVSVCVCALVCVCVR